MQIKDGVERENRAAALDKKQRQAMEAYCKTYLDFLGYAKTERR